ncbi:RNA polymerase sigma factor [Tamlana crocina]|uniref:Sigma-70 family RNA polymerase sigma factor n=1 Tax=Tamlana crocina TaxID=393006 RepID=A0ABX1DBP0_9FLAO|nr:sigma-70 family RNA polymerase sigma factor [Tamlana crocina]NJX14519.1 sigma-70 family RNA polymerase sigma factor [Tamlana crocina]
MGKTLYLLSQSQLIRAIKTNDTGLLKQFYVANYPKVETLVLKNSGTIEHAKDIYQEAFILVWTNVNNGKFVPQNQTALQGYLYQIAKNKWTDVLRSKTFKHSKYLDNNMLRSFENEEDDNEQENTKLEMAMEAFKNLGQPCKQLLKTFYFEKKPLRDIASELNIEEATARNKKYRCMEKLRNMVFTPKKEKIEK